MTASNSTVSTHTVRTGPGTVQVDLTGQFDDNQSMLSGLAVELDPGVKAVYGHAQALSNIGNRLLFSVTCLTASILNSSG